MGLQKEGDVPQLAPRTGITFAVPVQVSTGQALKLLATVAVIATGMFKTQQIDHEGTRHRQASRLRRPPAEEIELLAELAGGAGFNCEVS